MQAIELFAGAGGLGIGVSKAGFRPTVVVERDRYCRDTITENRKRGVGPVNKWPEHIEGDVRRTCFKQHEGKIDVVTGGPPCQPFSLGGKHRAYQDDRDLFPEAVRVVREVRPRAFIFENVKGLKRASFSSYFEYIVLQLQYPELRQAEYEEWSEHLRRLERHHTGRKLDAGLEYRVVSETLNAADYGIPQRRERVFFVGFRNDLNIEWSFPNETHSHDALLWDQVQSGEYWEHHQMWSDLDILSDRAVARGGALRDKPNTKLPWRTVRDALSDLPDPEFDPDEASNYHNHVFQPGARTYPGHTGSPLDEPAKTLKAGVHGVPGGENMLRRPNGQVRYFSVRESARLQTFPDDYVFHGSWTETMRQLGNAVPVDLAEIVASSVRSKLTSASTERSSTHGQASAKRCDLPLREVGG